MDRHEPLDRRPCAEALADAWQAKLADSTVVPLRQIVGMPGNPRAGYVVAGLCQSLFTPAVIKPLLVCFLSFETNGKARISLRASLESSEKRGVV